MDNAFYRILVSDNTQKGFKLFIALSPDDSAARLASIINAGCAFPQHLLCSFVLCDDEGVRLHELVPDASFLEESDPTKLDMEETSIGELEAMSMEGNLIYLYDFLSEEGLSVNFIDLQEGTPPQNPILSIHGNPPTMLNEDDMINDTFGDGEDFDEDFNDEDLDVEDDMDDFIDEDDFNNNY